MADIRQLIEDIRNHPTADFYRTRWGSASSFAALPAVTREEFASAALSSRLYAEGQGIVKVVKSPRSFLAASRLEDLEREKIPVAGKRPLVYMEDAHASVEEGLRCYLSGAVPLAAEKNPEIAALEAGAYQIDALVCDPLSIAKVEPYLRSRAEKVASITLINDRFDTADLARYEQFAESFSLVLSLPETGPIASAVFSATPTFVPLPNLMLERRETLLLTKRYMRAHPIIRFDTGIDLSIIESSAFV